MAKQVSTIEDITTVRGSATDAAELSESDRVLLESATGVAQPDESDDADPALSAARAAAFLDFASMPVDSEEDHLNQAGYDETVDGLSDIEEATRQQAEDRVTGDDEDYIA